MSMARTKDRTEVAGDLRVEVTLLHLTMLTLAASVASTLTSSACQSTKFPLTVTRETSSVTTSTCSPSSRHRERDRPRPAVALRKKL